MNRQRRPSYTENFFEHAFLSLSLSLLRWCLLSLSQGLAGDGNRIRVQPNRNVHSMHDVSPQIALVSLAGEGGKRLPDPAARDDPLEGPVRGLAGGERGEDKCRLEGREGCGLRVFCEGPKTRVIKSMENTIGMGRDFSRKMPLGGRPVTTTPNVLKIV